MSEVFEFVNCSPEQVVIKVKELDNLAIAMNPYVNSKYDYITVTRGKNHILTVIYKDGTTFGFSWGEGGYTLISEGLERLKKEVINFIETKCNILLDWDDSVPKEVLIGYNNNFKSWQLTLRNKNGLSCCKFFYESNSLEETIQLVKKFIDVKEWKHKIASTGVDIWEGYI